MKHLLFTLLGVLLAIYIDVPFYGSMLMCLALLYSSWLGRSNPNIPSLCIGILLIIAIEQAVFTLVPITGSPQVWVNNNIFVIHLSFDFSLLLFIVYRGALCRKLLRKWNYSAKEVHLTNADLSMLMVLVLITLVDIAALIENLLRNLEHLGFSEEFAKPLWELNWIFYHFGPIKYCLMGLQFLVLWSTVTKMAQKKSKLPGKLWA